jgi:hypothetical protein
MKIKTRTLTWTLSATALAALASAPLILADGYSHDHSRMHAEELAQRRGNASLASAAPADVAAYREECSACHVPYPAGLLAPADWQAILANLSSHYGVDASLDATTTQAVARAVGAAAASARPGELPRITQLPWFQREHRNAERRIRRPLPQPLKWSQCETCHAGAAAGNYEED